LGVADGSGGCSRGVRHSTRTTLNIVGDGRPIVNRVGPVGQAARWQVAGLIPEATRREPGKVILGSWGRRHGN
ncbi:MAG: hypothetical protein WCF17_17575, partial [Terracidiphilus sp.]